MRNKQKSEMEEALYEASWKVRKLHSLAWAVESLLFHNNDSRISECELQTRVGAIIEVLISEADATANYLDGGYQHVGDKT